jgi:hypothetical protein
MRNAMMQMQHVLDWSLERLDLPLKTHNSLWGYGKIRTVRDLVQKSKGELLELRCFGKTSLGYVRQALWRHGLDLGMTVSELSGRTIETRNGASMERESNNMSGTINVILDVYDQEDEQPDRQLVAWFYGRDAGCNDTSDLTFIVRTVDEDGNEIKDDRSSPLFIVSVARLRRLCDMAEAMHKVGCDQWAESLGTGAKT